MVMVLTLASMAAPVAEARYGDRGVEPGSGVVVDVSPDLVITSIFDEPSLFGNGWYTHVRVSNQGNGPSGSFYVNVNNSYRLARSLEVGAFTTVGFTRRDCEFNARIMIDEAN